MDARASAIALSYPVSRLVLRNWKDSPALIYRREIYKYALAFGNFGFMGNFIVLGVWGSEVFFKYTLFTFFLNIATYSWDMYVLIPK